MVTPLLQGSSLEPVVVVVVGLDRRAGWAGKDGMSLAAAAAPLGCAVLPVNGSVDPARPDAW